MGKKLFTLLYIREFYKQVMKDVRLWCFQLFGRLNSSYQAMAFYICYVYIFSIEWRSFRYFPSYNINFDVVISH